MTNGISILSSCSAGTPEAAGPSAGHLQNGSCQWCGSPVEPDVKLCSTCLQIQLDNLKVVGKKRSKLRQLIDIKIATRELEIKCIRQVGPALVVSTGILGYLAIPGIFIGIPLIVCGILWGIKRWNEKVNLESEIRELLAEQE